MSAPGDFPTFPGMPRTSYVATLGSVAPLFLSLSLGCGSVAEPPAAGSANQQAQPIINGEDSKDKQFPTVVGLLLDAYGVDPMSPNPLMPKCTRASGVCTGTLIREDVILTASHCVVNLLKQLPDPSCQKDPDPPQFTFEVDLIGAARGKRVAGSIKAVAHPMFGPTTCTNPPSVDRWNDIALVFLKRSVKGVPLQKIASPAEAPSLLKEGNKVRIVGYGKSKLDDNMSAGTQRFGTATLVKVGPHEIQGGQLGEQQACQGDSGGPVFANPDGRPEDMVQIGVASRLRTTACPSIWTLFNPPKCENGVFYTRIDPYYDWIKESLAKEPVAPAEEEDMRKPEPVDMARPEAPDLAMMMPGEEPLPPEEKGCQCSLGAASGSAPVGPMALLAGLLLARLGRRRRR